MEKKLSVLILFGGISSEHEVSCASAASIIKNIDKEKYEIYNVGITKQGNWFLTSSPASDIRDGMWEDDKNNRKVHISFDREKRGILIEKDGRFEAVRIDVVFPVLHGKNGEDGTMQGLLQIAGLPFVGSDTAASAESMDKAATKAVVEKAGGVYQADALIVYRGEFDKNSEGVVRKIAGYFKGKFPLFVKPSNAGSSVGITKIKHEEEIEKALMTAFAEDGKVLVEEGIDGREMEIAVLGNENAKASRIGEIFAANEFYDYNAKYENEASHTEIVTDLSPEKEKEMRDTAVRVYDIMGCRGLSRVDFFLQKDGRIIFNEINTLPGFTDISMYPKLWEATGLKYRELIDEIIRLALESYDE